MIRRVLTLRLLVVFLSCLCRCHTGLELHAGSDIGRLACTITCSILVVPDQIQRILDACASVRARVWSEKPMYAGQTAGNLAMSPITGDMVRCSEATHSTTNHSLNRKAAGKV